MTLFRRRQTRMDQITRSARAARGHLPSAPDVRALKIPSVEMPALPKLPTRPALNLRKRVSQDSSGDTPWLSLAGGLLLGLVVGMIVAVILISRSEDDDSSGARHTGITLLPSQDGDQSIEDESATGTG